MTDIELARKPCEFFSYFNQADNNRMQNRQTT